MRPCNLFLRKERPWLSPRQIEEALTLGRPVSDVAWVEAKDLGTTALEVALELMESGRVIEYECYDSEGNGQGRAVITLRQWEPGEKGFFTGTHGPSSYEWYVGNTGADSFLFHLCSGSAQHCRARRVRGDHRELVHIDRWRLLTPKFMMGVNCLTNMGRQLGEKALEDLARDLKDTKVHGTGFGWSPGQSWRPCPSSRPGSSSGSWIALG